MLGVMVLAMEVGSSGSQEQVMVSGPDTFSLHTVLVSAAFVSCTILDSQRHLHVLYAHALSQIHRMMCHVHLSCLKGSQPL